MQIEEIEKIENEIVGLGYLSPKEFLDIVADTSNDLNLKIINTDVKWKTYQRRKNGDVLCYTHIFSTIKTNKKPLKPAIWMLPTSPLPDYIDITFKYAFDFTFNKKTKNNAIKSPIIGVVPQFGATLPYSIFKGLRISPKRVFNAIY